MPASDRATVPRPAVALLPAAGHGTRLGPLPCSKEILPLDGRSGGRSRRLCDGLLDALAAAGVATGYVVLRPGKWDVAEYLASRETLGGRFACLTVEDSPSVPHTLDRAYPFVRHERVVLGFPDIQFRPLDAVGRVLDRQAATGADLALGLFPTPEPWKADMVETGPAGEVRRLVIKQPDCALPYTWSIAVWTPAFSDYLHQFLARGGAATGGAELYVGDVIGAAVEEGLETATVPFPDGESIDAGTPEGLRRAGGRLP